MADYELLDTVEADDAGLPVRLKLQRRGDVPPSAFFTVSWRTDYEGTTKNRRFYWVDGSCWTLRASTALSLLNRAAVKGMLDARYDDPYERFGGGGPSFVDSRALAPEQRATLWSEVTREGLEPNWGTAPSFVVATEAGGRWRKIMIVDEARHVATFRSCTTDANYAPRIVLPTTTTWYMDNAMQDAGTAIMRYLRTILAELVLR
jgi:hypothetical protein